VAQKTSLVSPFGWDSVTVGTSDVTMTALKIKDNCELVNLLQINYKYGFDLGVM
jgi:hypothetical protein